MRSHRDAAIKSVMTCALPSTQRLLSHCCPYRLPAAGAVEAGRQAQLTQATEGVIANGKWSPDTYEADTVNMQISMAKVSDANTSITWLAINAVVLYALKGELPVPVAPMRVTAAVLLVRRNISSSFLCTLVPAFLCAYLQSLWPRALPRGWAICTVLSFARCPISHQQACWWPSSCQPSQSSGRSSTAQHCQTGRTRTRARCPCSES